MTEKTQEWAERVGREAVELGFPCIDGLKVVGHATATRTGNEEWGDYLTQPDFRDRLTELACIAWVEDVARSKTRSPVHISTHSESDTGWVTVEVYAMHPDAVEEYAWEGAPTLAEACIAAVRAMKGEPC